MLRFLLLPPSLLFPAFLMLLSLLFSVVFLFWRLLFLLPPCLFSFSRLLGGPLFDRVRLCVSGGEGGGRVVFLFVLFLVVYFWFVLYRTM